MCPCSECATIKKHEADPACNLNGSTYCWLLNLSNFQFTSRIHFLLVYFSTIPSFCQLKKRRYMRKLLFSLAFDYYMGPVCGRSPFASLPVHFRFNRRIEPILLFVSKTDIKLLLKSTAQFRKIIDALKMLTSG